MLSFLYNIIRVYVNSDLWNYIFPYIIAMMVIIMAIHIIRRIINV